MSVMEQAWNDAPSVPSTLYEARALMLQIRDIDREDEEQDQLLAEIQSHYDDEKHKRAAKRELIRTALLQYVKAHGNAKVPDVGTAHAVTRKPAVVVDDPDMAVKVARELDPEGRDGLWKPVVSRTAMKQKAQERLEQTGELLPGCLLLPESTTLAIRFTK